MYECMDTISGALPSICFVAHNAYGALSGHNQSHAGGIERQQSLMAQWLANKGYPVSMVTWDEGQENGSLVNGVRVYKMCRRDSGVPVIRFVFPRWASLIKAMNNADADVYYYNCGDMALGQVVSWAHWKKRKVLYTVASDPDCIKQLPSLPSVRERVMYRYGLLRSDMIVVQTNKQKNLLKDNFNLEPSIINMPSYGFDMGSNASVDLKKENTSSVLWVGRYSTEKRLEWLLDVAMQLKGVTFNVVGAANVESVYTKNLVERAKKIGNVVLHGRVNYAEMSRFYKEASILCCTSRFEGFPNVFLEAWSVGLPIVSTVDPDNVIATNKLGFVVNDVDGAAAAIASLINDKDAARSMSENCVKYFSKNHSVDECMPRFEAALVELAKKNNCNKKYCGP